MSDGIVTKWKIDADEAIKVLGGAADKVAILDKKFADLGKHQEEADKSAARVKGEQAEKGAKAAEAALQKLEQAHKASSQRMLTQEEAHALAAQRVISNANAARVKTIVDASEKEQEAFGATGKAANALGQSIGSMIGVSMGMAGMASMARAVGDGFGSVSKRMEEVAAKIVEMRKRFPELASIESQKLTPKFTEDVVKYSSAIGGSVEEGEAFRKAAQSSGAQYAAAGGKIDEGAWKKALVKTGQTAMTFGGQDKEVLGDLVGSIAGSRDWKGASAATGTAQEDLLNVELARTYKIMEGGRGANRTNVANAAKGIAAFVSDKKSEGNFKGAAELAQWNRVMSDVNPEESFTLVKAAIKATTNYDDKKMKPLLDASGITREAVAGGQTFGQSIAAMKKVVMKEVAETGLPVATVIGKYAEDSREQLALTAAITRSEESLAVSGAEAAKITPATLAAESKAFQANPESDTARKVTDNAALLVDIKRGRAQADYATIEKQGYVAGRQTGELGDPGSQVAMSLTDKLSVGYQLGFAGSQEERIKARKGAELVIQRGKAAGVDVSGDLPSGSNGFESWSGPGRAEAMQKATDKITAAGGDPFGMTNNLLKDIKDKLPGNVLPAGPKDGGAAR